MSSHVMKHGFSEMTCKSELTAMLIANQAEGNRKKRPGCGRKAHVCEAIFNEHADFYA